MKRRNIPTQFKRVQALRSHHWQIPPLMTLFGSKYYAKRIRQQLPSLCQRYCRHHPLLPKLITRVNLYPIPKMQRGGSILILITNFLTNLHLWNVSIVQIQIRILECLERCPSRIKSVDQYPTLWQWNIPMIYQHRYRYLHMHIFFRMVCIQFSSRVD